MLSKHRAETMDHWAVQFGTVFMAFFAIMNPIANTPVFLGVTSDLDRAERTQVAFRSVLTAFVIVSVFIVCGRVIFDLFGISLPAFRVAGGLLVFLVGFHLLQGKESSVHTPSEEDNENSRDSAFDLAISPIAIPILAGPGTIATAMSYAAGTSLVEMGLTVAALSAICAITYVCFLFGERFTNFMGQNALKVVGRLMGLILAVIGTQMVMAGVSGAIEHYTSK